MPLPAPNTLAIIGAGPVGLEAALAALDHGFDVQVLEQGEVGSHPLAWGHVRMFTPWRMNLGKHSRAHLEAAGWTAPDPEACPTGVELAERYLQPLALLPELAGTHPPVHAGRAGEPARPAARRGLGRGHAPRAALPPAGARPGRAGELPSRVLAGGRLGCVRQPRLGRHRRHPGARRAVPAAADSPITSRTCWAWTARSTRAGAPW